MALQEGSSPARLALQDLPDGSLASGAACCSRTASLSQSDCSTRPDTMLSNLPAGSAWTPCRSRWGLLQHACWRCVPCLEWICWARFDLLSACCRRPASLLRPACRTCLQRPCSGWASTRRAAEFWRPASGVALQVYLTGGFHMGLNLSV